MRPSAVRAVIFDMDGLMLDTEVISRRSWQRAANDFSHVISDELFTRFIGRTSPDCEAILHELWGDFSFSAFRERITFHWDELVREEGISLKTGLIELIDSLDARRLPKAVATSSYRERALIRLGQLANRFDTLVTGDEITRGKPAPDIFLLAAQRLAIAPDGCIVLEDSHAGLEAARAAGMHAIMVPDLLPPQEDTAHVCASLHEVRLWLEGIA
jgi:HAD superfamily hydrolase (TIGR01509 family)